MQRTAIAAFAILAVALALVACGGGDDATTSAPTAEQTQPAEAREELRQQAERIEKERRGQAAGGGQEQGGQDASPAPAPAPPVEHSDSGGGAGEFLRKGGDNSIQELGQEGSASERERAARVLHAFLDARAQGRWEDACSYLAAEVIASLERFSSAYSEEMQLEGCPDILQALGGAAGAAALRAAAEADVGSLRVEGQRGFLLYHGPQGVDYAMPVVLEAGEWKLSAPDATPLP